MDDIKKNEEMTVFEGEKLIEDHEYDGIHELDNSPPPWLLGIWWFGVAFAVIFLLYYHVFGGPTQEEKYEKAMAEALENMPVAEDVEIIFLDDVESLESGKKVWDAQCVACHLADGGGSIGPNMTDQYWKHGNKIEDMVRIITNGVEGTGMTEFGTKLRQEQIVQVSSYIWTLQGTTPAVAKDPEGTLYE